mgnify:FL=1
MSLIGSVPGQKKKKKKDLKIGERLKKLFKGKKGPKMSLLGDLPGEENNTPYTKTAKRFNNENVKKVKKKRTNKPLNKVQARFKKRVSEGKSGLTGGPKGETITEYRARQKKRIQDAARKRNAEFKKTGKSTVEQRRAEAKKRMQEAARKRNEAYKAKRKLKAKNKSK